MSTEEKVDIGKKLKKDNLEKLYRIVLLEKLYSDNKKILKSLKKILIIEEKRMKGSRFAVTDDSFSETIVFFTESKMIVKSLIAAKSTEGYSRAKRELENHLLEVASVLSDLCKETNSETKSFFTTVKNKMKAIKNAVVEEVEQIKADLCNSKDEN